MKERGPLPILSWPRALLPMLGAIVCFHLAYSFEHFNALRFCILGFPIFLVQIARLRTTRQCFYSGLAVGFVCVAPQLECFWRIFGPAAIPLWIILAFWIAVFVATIHGAVTRFGPCRAAVATPIVWTGFEYFRSELYYLKFSWLNIGYAFSAGDVMPFHLYGMYGVGFVAAIVAGLFLVVRWYYGLVALAATVAVSAAIAALAPAIDGQQVRVAGVQLEFPSESQLPKILDRLAAKHPNADLFVLSEYTLDGPPPETLRSWCRQNHHYLIVGGKDPTEKDQFYNTAFVVGPDGEIVFRQVKSVPIQFFKDGLPAPQQAVWQSPWGKIGICICYDLSYTRVTDRLVRLGAQLIIVPTMDVSDWGKHQHQLHALVAPVRAVEYGIPIFRLASSGISQAVNGQGKVIATAPFLGDESDLFAEMRVEHNGSLPWDRYVAPFAVGVTACVILTLVVPRRRREISDAPMPEPATSEKPSMP